MSRTPTRSWSVLTETISVSFPWSGEPEVLEISYRCYLHMDYGLVPLTDDEWAAGTFTECTPFNAPAGQRHYLRIQEVVDA